LQEPSHATVPSEVQAVWPGCGGLPAVMVPHVPAAAPVLTPVHASHCPVQARSQQVPSGAQASPVRHWFAAVQAPPLSSFATQLPLASHQFPGEQAVSRTQPVRQPSPPQAYGAQGVVLASGQRPAPSHEAGFSCVDPVQVWLRHCQSG